jgi:hypothetical protein
MAIIASFAISLPDLRHEIAQCPRYNKLGDARTHPAASPPDGYTLLLSASSIFVVLPELQKGEANDVRAFVPIRARRLRS